MFLFKLMVKKLFGPRKDILFESSHFFKGFQQLTGTGERLL